jgi:hypothetical protein
VEKLVQDPGAQDQGHGIECPALKEVLVLFEGEGVSGRRERSLGISLAKDNNGAIGYRICECPDSRDARSGRSRVDFHSCIVVVLVSVNTLVLVDLQEMGVRAVDYDIAPRRIYDRSEGI